MPAHAIVRDFDTFIPPARWVRLGGKELNITRIPSRATFELLAYADEVKGKAAEDLSGADALRLIEIVAGVVESQNPGVDLEWLKENTFTDQLLAFVAYVASLIKGGTVSESDAPTPPEATGKN